MEIAFALGDKALGSIVGSGVLMKFTVAVVIGSLREGSFNRQLAGLAMEVGREWFEFTEAPIGDLPLFNQDLEVDVPSVVVEFKQTIATADAVLVVTPEYNRSIPGVLKNAIDWASRPDDSNSWTGKPIGIMGASNGQFGTINAQFDVRKVFVHTNSLVMPQPQVMVTNAQRKLIDGQFDDKTQEVVKRFMKSWSEWVKDSSKPGSRGRFE
jgi:chromate reductase